MKYLRPATAVAATIAISATQANSGGMAEPMMEPEVIEEASATTGGFVIPLLLLVIIAAIASGSSGGGNTQICEICN